MAANSLSGRWGRRSAVPFLLFVVLATFAAPAQSQTANVAVSLQVSKVTDVRLDDELLVSTTVRNNGPSPAVNATVAAGQETLEPFLYTLIGSESPECGMVEQVDVDPPAYSFFWVIPSIAVGSAITCTARLRAIAVPSGHSSILFAGAQPGPQATDPDNSDNFAQVLLRFALPSRAHVIPSGSWWACAIAICGVLLGGLVLRRG